jgi:hypothetical protein
MVSKLHSIPKGGHAMQHYSAITLQHVRHYSLRDLKDLLSSHAAFLDGMLEKVMETGTIIAMAGFIYMVAVAILALNHANHAYSHGVSCIACDSIQIVYSAIQGLI